MVQLLHPYVTTGKTIALTGQMFVGKAMSLLLNMLSRFVIAFLPRSKHLLISWLQSQSAVILEPQKIKSVWNSWFFSDPADVGNLISGSSAFPKSSLNSWNFMDRVLVKLGLKNFEHCFASVWDECSCVVIWIFLALPFFEIGIKTDLFQSCGHCLVFKICWHIECGTFTASSFRI